MVDLVNDFYFTCHVCFSSCIPLVYMGIAFSISNKWKRGVGGEGWVRKSNEGRGRSQDARSIKAKTVLAHNGSAPFLTRTKTNPLAYPKQEVISIFLYLLFFNLLVDIKSFKHAIKTKKAWQNPVITSKSFKEKIIISRTHILISFCFSWIIHQFLNILQVDFTLYCFNCIISCLQTIKHSLLLAC